MSEPFDAPRLESTNGPQTARIGGRKSAVIGSVAVIGVLVAVVWVGISGRSAPVAPPPNPAVAVQPSVAPTPGEPTSSTIGQPDGPVSVVTDDVFGVFATFGANRYITILTETEPGHLVGGIAIPLPIDQSDGSFAFQQFSAPEARGRPVKIATWPINVETVAADSPLVVVVDASVPARPTIPGSTRPVRLGFRLTVLAQRNGNSGELRIDVLIGGTRRRITGDDGISPPAAWNPRVDRPVVVTYDRTRGRYNYCRWDVTPLSAPPRPGTDEAAC